MVFHTAMQSLGVSERQLLEWMSYIEIITALVLIPTLKVIPPPYGRHGHPKWGPTLPARFAWFIQELPSFVFPVCYWCSGIAMPKVNSVLLLMLMVHYFQR